MQELKKEKLSLEIQNNYLYNLDIPADGTCLIEIIANAKSWWQNTKSFKSFFQDDDLAVKIDGIEFPKLSGKRGLFDGEAAWNGNNLKGLSKTNLFLVKLDKGSHAFNFLADQTPILESIAIYATDEAELNYIPTENNPAQDDNRRQWITIILVNIAIKNLTIKATAKKYPNNADDDDLKLILDGKIEPNTEDKSHKNWFWCGRTLQGQEKEFNRELSWQAGLHYVELWADRTPELKSFNIELMSGDTNQQNKWTQLKQYIFKGSNGKENYNRYDKQIIEVVDFWNKEFFSQEFPPNEPLDPNLVKAMIFQESRVGYFTGAEINIMQVGNLGDPSLDVLSGKTKNPEYETINGQLWKVDYDNKAKVESIQDSIKWGVRWLYHRAQKNESGNKRSWFSWKDSVMRYGPANDAYVNNVWRIYTKGVDERTKPSIKLWTFVFLMFLPIATFSSSNNFLSKQSIESAILNTINDPNEKAYIRNIEVQYYKKNNPLFLTIIETEKNWWERFEIGNYKNSKITWFEIADKPTEQDIASVRFLNLAGFDNPIVEIYGKTHMAHGAFYLYEIKDNRAILLLRTPAVDSNNDVHWAPDKKEKYGYENCGEIFTDEKLKSTYKDLNGDGCMDVVLSGTQEIVCELYELNSSNYTEIIAAKNPVEKVFLWDASKKEFVSK